MAQKKSVKSGKSRQDHGQDASLPSPSGKRSSDDAHGVVMPEKSISKDASSKYVTHRRKSKNAQSVEGNSTPSDAASPKNPVDPARSSLNAAVKAVDSYREGPAPEENHLEKLEDELSSSRSSGEMNSLLRGLNRATSPAGHMQIENVSAWLGNWGALKISIAGLIDQACLDSKTGLNMALASPPDKPVLVKDLIWVYLSKNLGLSVLDEIKFDFLPCVDFTELSIAGGTNLTVPLVFAGNPEYTAPLISVHATNGEPVELSGQVFIGSYSVKFNILSGQLIIDHAFKFEGFINVNSGASYYFKGLAPDESVSPVGLKIKSEDVHLDNGLWANVLTGSTLKIDGGAVGSSATGVIVFVKNSTLSITAESNLSGNIIIEGDGNSFDVAAKFLLSDGAKIVVSANVDLKNLGFSGDGALVVSGAYLKDSKWIKSALNVSDGASIGNLAVGYNPFGGMFLTNTQSHFGASASFAGSITLSGSLSIGGDDKATGEVTLAKETKLTRTESNKSGTVDVANEYGILTLSDSVTFDVPLKIEGGTVICGDNDSLRNVSMSGGKFTCGKSDSLDSLSISGGEFISKTGSSPDDALKLGSIQLTGGSVDVSRIVVTGDITISGGRLFIATFEYGKALEVTGSGAISIGSGSLARITINSSGDSTIGAKFASLELGAANSGTTTLSDTAFSTISVAKGSLKFEASKASVAKLTFTGGEVSSQNSMVFDNLLASRGELTFASLEVKQSLVIGNSSLTADNITYTVDNLAISGSGSVHLSHGTLKEVTVNSSSDSSFGTKMTSLTLMKGNKSTVELAGGAIETLTLNAGAVRVTDAVKLSTFNFLDGTVSVSGNLVVSDALNITGRGGVITFSGSRGEISVKKKLTLSGALNISGSGELRLSGDVTGVGAQDFISVKSGATSRIMKTATVSPEIHLDAGGRVIFEDAATSEATVVCSDDAVQNGSILQFSNASSDGLVTHVNVKIENYRQGIKLYFDNLWAAGASFQKAYYSKGSVHVLYDKVNNATNVSETREIILDHVSGQGLSENQSLDSSVMPDGVMTWDNAYYWYLHISNLKVGLSGYIDQKCLDSSEGINKKSFGWGWISTNAKSQAWGEIGTALGKKFDSKADFTFLPCIARSTVSFKSTTIVKVPILIASGNASTNPEVNVNAGFGNIVRLNGQIIYGNGFLNVVVDSGTLSIYHAFAIRGDFYIKPNGHYIFSGAAPDTAANAAGLSVKESDVRYDNGNSSHQALWVQILDGSTVYLEGGTVGTEGSGVIVLNSKARLFISVESTLSGNYVIGWNYNTVVANAKFVLASGGKVVASASVDFGRYGYSGAGELVVSGKWWDGGTNTWKDSSVSFADQSSIGNLTVGYNPFYNQGLGSSAKAFGETRVNKQPRFGGLGKLSGAVTLHGTLSVGGGDNVYGKVDLSTGSEVVTDKDGVIDVKNSFGILTLNDSVTLKVRLQIEDGAVSCGINNHLQSVILSGGKFTATSSTTVADQLEIGSLQQSGGVFSASWAKVTDDAIVSGGSLSVHYLSCSGSLSITGSGAVALADGKLQAVSIGSSSDNSIGATFTSLELLSTNSGTTTLSRSVFSTISVAGGMLELTAENVRVTFLSVTGNGIVDCKSISLGTLVIGGGSSIFDKLVVENKFSVSGGFIEVRDVSFTVDALAITNTGAVNFRTGTLGVVTVKSSGDSSFGTDMKSLTLQSGGTGTVTLTGGTLDELSQQYGRLNVSGAVIVKGFGLSDGNATVSGSLTIDGTSFSAGASASISLDGGALVFKNSGSFDIDSQVNVLEAGGTIDFGATGAGIKIKNGATLKGALTFKGQGVVKLYGAVSGDGEELVINVGAGTTLMIMNKASISPTVKLQAQGVLRFEDGTNCSASVEVSDEAAKTGCVISFEEAFDPTQMETHIKVKIKNFGDGVKIDLRGLNFKDVSIIKAYYQDGKIHVVYDHVASRDSRGVPKHHELIFDHVSGDGLKNGQILTVHSDGDIGTDIETCFLPGTRIKTPQGWRMVEALAPGDLVIAVENDKEVERPVRWVGEGRVVCRSNLPDDLAGYAVRVARDAFGPGMPFEDVLITSEHCIYVDGGLIPVRMLVNGESIAYERTMLNYSFYHFELEKHAIVSAAGLPAETYLDTGNRARYSAGTGVVSLRPKTLEAAAAPLLVSQSEVEPVYKRLAARSVGRQRPQTCPISTSVPKPLVMDADVHLVMLNGEEIWPISRRGGGYLFDVPQDVENVFIASRASRPCDVIGPYVDDRRTLGVLVGAIHLIEARQMVSIDNHLSSDLKGWHGVEQTAARWTDGYATLNLPASSQKDSSGKLLFVQILQQGPYLISSARDSVRLEIVAA